MQQIQLLRHNCHSDQPWTLLGILRVTDASQVVSLHWCQNHSSVFGWFSKKWEALTTDTRRPSQYSARMQMRMSGGEHTALSKLRQWIDVYRNCGEPQMHKQGGCLIYSATQRTWSTLDQMGFLDCILAWSSIVCNVLELVMGHRTVGLISLG